MNSPGAPSGADIEETLTNRTTALRLDPGHLAHRLAAAQERPGGIDRHGSLPAFERNIGKKPRSAAGYQRCSPTRPIPAVTVPAMVEERDDIRLQTDIDRDRSAVPPLPAMSSTTWSAAARSDLR